MAFAAYDQAVPEGLRPQFGSNDVDDAVAGFLCISKPTYSCRQLMFRVRKPATFLSRPWLVPALPRAVRKSAYRGFANLSSSQDCVDAEVAALQDEFSPREPPNREAMGIDMRSDRYPPNRAAIHADPNLGQVQRSRPSLFQSSLSSLSAL